MNVTVDHKNVLDRIVLALASHREIIERRTTTAAVQIFRLHGPVIRNGGPPVKKKKKRHKNVQHSRRRAFGAH